MFVSNSRGNIYNSMSQKQRTSLVFSNTTAWDVHHADTLEVIHRLDAQGDKIYLLSCDGELSTCPPNPHHDISICARCKKITGYTERKLLPKSVSTLRLKLENIHFANQTFDSIESLLSTYHYDLPIGRLVASQLADDQNGIYGLVEIAPTTTINSMIHNGINLYEQIKKIIVSYSIDAVFVWNGRRPSDGPVLYAAAELGKEHFVYISGGRIGYLQMFSGFSVQDLSRIKIQLDQIKQKTIKNESIRTDGIDYFKKYIEGTVTQIGYVHFNKKFKKSNLKLGEKPYLLVVTSSPTESIHTNEHIDFYGSDPYETIYSIVSDERVLVKYDVIIRWHPAKKYSNPYDLKKIHEIATRNDGIINILPNSEDDTYSMLSVCKVVLSFGSTVGYVAAMEGKPVVLAGPISSLFDTSFYCAGTVSKAIEYLTQDLEPLPKSEISALGYWFSNFGSPMRFISQCQKENGAVISRLTWRNKTHSLAPRGMISMRKLFRFIYALVRTQFS